MKPFASQIIVAIIVGVLSSLGTGTLTAYVLTQEFDKKLDRHIVQNESEAAQIRRDIARIEQDNIKRDGEANERQRSINQIKTDVAVIRQIVEGVRY